MRCPSTTIALVSVAALTPNVLAGPLVEHALRGALAVHDFIRRASPEAPDGYTPVTGDCPTTTPTIRIADGLSTNETEWLEIRRNVTIPAMKTLLAQLNITGLDTDSYIENHMSNTSLLPNIGIAVSGGGYRAMLNAAGAVAAFDNRTTHNSTASAALGGLLQSATYLAGLSGGSWMVGSLYVNNFTSVQNILNLDTADTDDTGSLWQLGNSIFEGPASEGIQLLSTAEYYDTIYDEVQGKNDAGYTTTITDYWGRALSFQLINATDGGPAYTFSSIADATWFTDGSVPLPFLVTDGRTPGELLVNGNSTVYEISPWELGTYDPTTYAFAPIRYLGTNFTDGNITSGDGCVRGFDNAGLMMGTSSSLFNEALLELNSTGFSTAIEDALKDILEDIGEDNDDIAYYPNPFYGLNKATSYIYNETQLTLVDGGEDGQNIPLHPLIQPVRAVDVIFAVDSSADTASPQPAANWPNGTSLVATYERQFLAISNGTVFPSIPDQQTFVNLGLNNRPTFFGCNASNITGTAPLIVYLPNAPYAYLSNVSTYDLEYNDTERNAIIENGYDVATMGNGTLDSNWPACVGCAILSRSFNRTNTTVPDICNTCFTTYCWDGTLNTTASNYTPSLKLDEVKVTSAATHTSHGTTLALTAAIFAAVTLVL